MDFLTRQTRDSYEHIAAEYAKRNSGGMSPFLEGMAQKLSNHLGPGSNLLDIGCGPGYEMSWFEQYGINTVGIDFTTAMIDIARSQAKGYLLQMDQRALAFHNASFDGAWWCASLLHISKREAPSAISGVRCVLRNGAMMMVSVQQGEGEKCMESSLGGPPRFFAWYQPEEIRTILQQNGFEVRDTVSTRENDHDWIALLCIAR